MEDLGIEEDKIIEYKSADAVAFWYKEHPIVIDNIEHKIMAIGGDEIESDKNGNILYEDLLDEGKYVFYAKLPSGYGPQQFWLAKHESRSRLKTVFFDNQCPDNVCSKTLDSVKSLEYAYLPDGWTKINDYMFYQCSELKKIALPGGLVSIGKTAFAGCSSLKRMIYPELVTDPGTLGSCSSIEEVILPPNLTSIPGGMFEYCPNLKEIYIPKSVTSIGGAASGGSGLQKVYYGGTSEDRNGIEIDTYRNGGFTNESYWYYYSETKPEEEGRFWHWVGGKMVEW